MKGWEEKKVYFRGKQMGCCLRYNLQTIRLGTMMFSQHDHIRRKYQIISFA